MRRNQVNREGGSALVVVLALMAMLFLIGTMAVDNALVEVDLSYDDSNTASAFYIAQAGARHAVIELIADSSWRDGFSEVSFNGGEYTVEVIDSVTDSTLSDSLLIRSSGTINGSRCQIELTVAPGQFHPFAHAMFADDLVDIRNSMTTDSYCSDSGTYASTRDVYSGDVGSNGTIDVKNGAFIGGDIATSLTGGAIVNPGTTVTGTVSDDAPETELEEIPAEEFAWAESVSAATTGISGSYTYDAATHSLISSGTFELQSGVYYFSDIILKNSASLTLAPGAEVTIYVSGNIELKQSSEVNVTGAPGDLIFYSQGDIVLKNSGEITAVFYSPGGNADLRNSGEFYGSIVAETIVAHNSASFHYDRTLSRISRKSTEGIEVVAFREM